MNIFELDISLHKNDGITEWTPPESKKLWWSRRPDGPEPTLFCHPWYTSYERYPKGVADMIGYWAENRILGGVVLFDRRDQGTSPDVDSNAVYFHSSQVDTTYRIYQLLSEQKPLLISFLTADLPLSTHPLPILGDESNRIRIDPEESTTSTGIYRDTWDRKELSPEEEDRRLHCCFDKFEFLTLDEWWASKGRAYDRKWRIEYGDDWEDRLNY